jgi:molybdate transport system substrate-binding protein
MRRALCGAVAALGVTVVVAGCGGSSTGGSSGASSSASATASSKLSGTINVFAAASLTEAFTTLGKQFEAAHPGVKVVFNFGASSTLAQQINQGAPADVFASASTKNMAQVMSAGGAKSSTPFVKNVMEIATPPSNPAQVSAVNDLAKSSVKVALCQVQVPCGATAEKVFTNAKITVKPVTEEADVKSVLSKVELGEVDAGVVYVTDVRSAGSKVKGITIPTDVNASTTYPIATLTDSHNTRTAQAFVDYVLSSAGEAVLTADGFAQP